MARLIKWIIRFQNNKHPAAVRYVQSNLHFDTDKNVTAPLQNQDVTQPLLSLFLTLGPLSTV